MVEEGAGGNGDGQGPCVEGRMVSVGGMTRDGEGTEGMSGARPPRRPRYAGKNPRKFAEKYKEHRGDGETLSKVAAAGKTPAGTHRPIMVDEVLQVLGLEAGEVVADATLGFGGHAAAMLGKGAVVHAFDVDPVEGPRTVERMRAAGYGEDVLLFHPVNFAGMGRELAAAGYPEGVDAVFADLGLSSMQIDDPARGFTWKENGPLDMRLNPQRGVSAGKLLAGMSEEKLVKVLTENADEPLAREVAAVVAGREFAGTAALAEAVRAVVAPVYRLRVGGDEEVQRTIRRVFQALRIEVNGEFSALDAFLRALPGCLRAGGRAALLTFHSGEDRRVKHAFAALAASGGYYVADDQPWRASVAEQRANSRSTSAKLRWIERVVVDDA